ncbi:exo-1,3-beta-glucanase [Tulasnella sp. 403]|nr:exo-1,3-beta-glucanase [Tulasnella sp. 403]
MPPVPRQAQISNIHSDPVRLRHLRHQRKVLPHLRVPHLLLQLWEMAHSLYAPGSRMETRQYAASIWVDEPWINPGMFNATNNNAIVDEYTYGLYQDQSEAQGILENHWDTWITEDDFAAISAAGLNHVRIPMPYWSIPTPNTTTQPFITGSWPRLLRAVSWASKYDLSVIIDIHGAPGSQNGYDNSGQKMDYPQWHTSQANVDRTLQAFQALLGEFSQSKWGGTVGAIEALNEPAGIYQDVLNVTNQYWTEAYTRLQALRVSRGTERAGDVNPQEIKMVIMDGFIGIQNYRGFLTPPQSQGVMMDTHCYQLFNTEQIALTQAQHIPQACAVGQSLATGAAGGLWTYVGEWTSSPTDCTPWLNGRFAPSVWVTAVPGRSCTGMTGRWQNFTDDYKNFLAQYFEAQVEAYEMVQGWIYWTWKTETTDEWSYQKGMEGGWIPKNINDSTQRRFPNICKQP